MDCRYARTAQSGPRALATADVREDNDCLDFRLIHVDAIPVEIEEGKNKEVVLMLAPASN